MYNSHLTLIKIKKCIYENVKQFLYDGRATVSGYVALIMFITDHGNEAHCFSIHAHLSVDVFSTCAAYHVKLKGFWGNRSPTSFNYVDS